MALTLEEINKKKLQKKNNLNLNSSESSRPYEIKKGELKKQPTNLEKLEKQLERVEDKTNKMLERVKKINNDKLTANEQVINNKLTSNEHFEQVASRKKIASFFEYQCLKGLPKMIMAEIKKNVQFNAVKNEYTSILDTEILKSQTGKSANHIAVQVGRMIEQGFFEILYSTKSGVRIVKVIPEIIGINTTAN